MKAYELAEKIDRFAEDYDPFEYRDVCGDREKMVKELTWLIENEPTAIINFLSEIIDLDDDEETTAEATALLADVKNAS